MGDLPWAKKNLERGADVNYLHNDYGTTCLMGAVLGLNKEVVSLLLEQPGIEVNAKGDGGRTALTKQQGETLRPYSDCFWIFQELTGRPRLRMGRLP